MVALDPARQQGPFPATSAGDDTQAAESQQGGIGEIPADQEPILKEVLEGIREFRVADNFIPAGSQVLRFHARQVLRPLAANT